MVTHHIIHFPGLRPTIDSLLSEIHRVSGIEVSYNEEKFLLYSSANKDKVYLYFEENNSYAITLFETKINYLLGVALAVLIKMGGKIDIAPLPEWTELSWSSIKKQFSSLPRIIWYNEPNDWPVIE